MYHWISAADNFIDRFTEPFFRAIEPILISFFAALVVVSFIIGPLWDLIAERNEHFHIPDFLRGGNREADEGWLGEEREI